MPPPSCAAWLVTARSAAAHPRPWVTWRPMTSKPTPRAAASWFASAFARSETWPQSGAAAVEPHALQHLPAARDLHPVRLARNGGLLRGDDALGATELDMAVTQERLHKSLDRKSTRLNSSHLVISFAVFCLK